MTYDEIKKELELRFKNKQCNAIFSIGGHLRFPTIICSFEFKGQKCYSGREFLSSQIEDIDFIESIFSIIINNKIITL